MKKLYLFLSVLILSASPAKAQWQLMDSIDAGNFVNIHFFDAHKGIISGEMDGRFLLTNNGGLSWDTIKVPFLDMYTDFLTDMQFVTDDIGFVCGGSGFSMIPNILMTTKDGGHTWDSVTVTNAPVYEFTGVDFKQTTNDVEGVVVSYSNIFHVTDTGRTFQSMVKPTFNFTITDAVFTGGSRVLLLGYDFASKTHRIYSTDDWGINWDLRYQDTLAVTSIGFASVYGLAGCGKGTILKSSDGGNNWAKQKIAPDTITFNKVKFGNNGFAYLLGYKTIGNGGGYIYGSENFGQSWHSVQVDPQFWLSDLAMPTIATGYVISNRKLYKTTTGGGLGLSVADVDGLADGINVYPNPASKVVHIEVPLSMRLVSLAVYDATGKLVKSNSENTHELDLSHLSRGTYLLEINTGQGVYKRKLLLQ
ncbi:YCF48-related protein [Polluticoccus soli]|uniref:T9SS type A sorting domain-containing protein n=1 Tax=Polluticoccus soli TaxID=3034150 RepID=UPI0023E1F450|nr:YCF48-related protein [Flavipsychrobacter sp. JY13-12]